MASGIGEIGVRVSADTTDFASGMNRAAQIAETSMRRAEQAQRIAQQASDKFVASLKYQVETFGKNEEEILRYKAGLLGASEAATPLIARLEELKKIQAANDGAEAISRNSHAMEEFGFKTVGAKRELLVLAHELSQGNFSKFGGSMLVLAEQTGAASLLFNPLTLGILTAVAALGVLAAQVYKGHEEWTALGDAVRLTGDSTGYTRSQLDQMSVRFAKSSQEILSGREALTALIATGRFTGEQLQFAGRAALDMAKDTGSSIEDVSKELAKLPDGARKWAEEYQKTHHAFTAANIELIDSLEKQGKQADATVTALTALAQAHNRVSNDMRQDKGTWDRFWDDWADGLARIKEGLRAIGKPESNFDQIKDALAQRDGLLKALKVNQERLDGSGGKDEHLKAQVDGIKAAIQANLDLIAALRKRGDTEKQQANEHAALAASGDAQIAANKYLDGGVKSDSRQHLDQIAKENQAYQEALARLESSKSALDKARSNLHGDTSSKQYQEIIANLRTNTATYEQVVKQHKENLAEIDRAYAAKTKPKEYQDDAATKYLERLRAQDAEIQAQLKSSNSLPQAQKEQASFEQQLLDFKGKKLTKEQQSLVANQAAIRAQLTKNVADAEELRIKQEVEKLDERAAQINAQMASAEAGRRDAYQRQLGAYGHGQEAQQKVAALQSIYKEYERYEEQLTKSTPKDLLGSEQYRADVKKIHDGLGVALADFDTYYASLKQKQSDWTNGAEQAYQNYLSTATNVAAQVEGAFTSAFRSMEDFFVQFVTTGKLNFASLTTSILADIARIQARQAIAGLLNSNVNWGDTIGSFFGPSTIGSGLSGARAAGGPVSSGASYLVGENGPEIFTPSGGGTIIPNHAISGSGGGATFNMTTYISDSGASGQSSGSSGAAKALGDSLNTKWKAFLVQEMRQGGLIWNYQNRGIAP